MLDSCSIWLPDAKLTHSAGVSLASTIYGTPLTITLSGELGAGKTTFLQGVLSGLGIDGPVTSPTYALEQRYESDIGTVSHIDLYRLDQKSAMQFMEECDDDVALRCIEWPERSNTRGDIEIHLQEDTQQHGRKLDISFADIKIPNDSTIALWRDEVSLPDHITKHCEAVADFACVLASDLLSRGIVVRIGALRAAGKVHDLLRFVDFTKEEEPDAWEQIREQYKGVGHEAACASFLTDHGFTNIADIVVAHGLKFSPPKRTTIEQQLLYYADKRVMNDEVVSLQQRFDDFNTRYANGKHTKESEQWLQEAQQVEQQLFPEGAITS